ncbi:MAG: DUF2269 family protein [Vulcanimicrobiaceae bacterium]
MGYHVLVFVHVLSAIVAVGYNATYAVWFARGGMQREHLAFALRGIKFMDDFVANPAYFVLLLSGAALVHLSGRPWNELWIELALALWLVLIVAAYGAYTPALSNQIRVLAAAGPDAAAYKAADARQTVVGIALVVVALAVVGLMVFRPGGA